MYLAGIDDGKTDSDLPFYHVRGIAAKFRAIDSFLFSLPGDHFVRPRQGTDVGCLYPHDSPLPYYTDYFGDCAVTDMRSRTEVDSPHGDVYFPIV